MRVSNPQWATFGGRIDAAYRRLVETDRGRRELPDSVTRFVEETLKVRGKPMHAWTRGLGKTGLPTYPGLDTVVRVWEKLCEYQPFSLVWLCTGEGGMLTEEPVPKALTDAMFALRPPPSKFVRDAATLYSALHHPRLDESGWRNLLDKLVRFEQEGVSLVTPSPSDGGMKGDTREMYQDIGPGAPPAKRASAPRPKRLRKER